MSYTPNPGSGTIHGSGDAALSNLLDGQYLTYNLSVQKWQNATATVATPTTFGVVKLAGDLAGTAASPVVAKVNGITLPSAAPTTGQVLTATSTTATGWATPATGGSSPVTSVAGRTGAITLAEADVTNLSTDLSTLTTNVSNNTTAITAKAPLASPTFTGTVTLPSATPTAATQAATKAYVDSVGSSAVPLAQKAAASGVASLDTNTLVPKAQLGTGTASSSTVLYGDGTWRTPTGGSTSYTWTGTKTSAYTAASGDAIVCDATSAGFTVTLPTTLGANAFVRVKKIDSTVNAILITSTANIDNGSSFSLNSQYASQDFSYTGTTWYAV